MKIGVISPSEAFTKVIRDVGAAANVSLIIKESALQRGLYHAKKLIEEEQVNIIIARGPTADLLMQKLDVPVIKVNITSFDLLEAFQKAKKKSNQIVFIDHVENKKLYNLPLIEEILSIEIVLREYRNEADINNHIASLASENEPAIIVATAQCVAKTALQFGITCIIVESTSEAISEALKRAQEMSDLYEREKLRQKHLETIISYAFDGVIATDETGQITVFNKMASKAIGLDPKEVIGRYLSKLQHPFLKKLYGDGLESTHTIVSFGSNNYVVNRIPIDNNSESIVITFQEINKVTQFNSRIRSELYNRRFYAKYTFADIAHQSEIMKHTVELAKKYSVTDSNILIIGESGTGKELFAQSIHNESSRKNGPFIAINCAALPESLLETELFGYEEGAFTGAKKGGKPGLFEMAHEGTLFLDEIGELPLALQSRLLRVLQEKEVMRVGGEKIIPVDVRIIAATNKNLRESIKTNDFRSDLYYRLNILQITLPPLRQRKEDIRLLVSYFQQKYNGKSLILDKETLNFLESYDWPGNVRELENVMERLIAIGTFSSTELKKLIFQDQLFEKPQEGDEKQLRLNIGSMEDMERQIIHELYKRYRGNKQILSHILGISRTTLWKKIKEIETDNLIN
jgi:transcriptional regulator with PAS, ATPase and Fis domain